jgi:hypothetical protein
MPAYIPPHLRPGYQAQVEAAQAKAEEVGPKRRGVHFKSNISGLPSHNIRWHRYNKTPARSPTAAEKKAMKYNLSARRLTSKKRKSALKGTKRAVRRTRSNSPKRKTHKRRKVKSA